MQMLWGTNNHCSCRKLNPGLQYADSRTIMAPSGIQQKSITVFAWDYWGKLCKSGWPVSKPRFETSTSVTSISQSASVREGHHLFPLAGPNGPRCLDRNKQTRVLRSSCAVHMTGTRKGRNRRTDIPTMLSRTERPTDRNWQRSLKNQISYWSKQTNYSRTCNGKFTWPGSSHVGFVVDKAVPGQGFSDYFGLPCQPFIPPIAPQSSSSSSSITQGWYYNH
jgi:hypothetical protein